MKPARINAVVGPQTAARMMHDPTFASVEHHRRAFADLSALLGGIDDAYSEQTSQADRDAYEAQMPQKWKPSTRCAARRPGRKPAHERGSST